MSSTTIFIIASILVLIALAISFACWMAILESTKKNARVSAGFFVTCFGLYIVGQSLALLQGLRIVNGLWAIPSLCYALAAILFAVGSWYQLKSVKR